MRPVVSYDDITSPQTISANHWGPQTQHSNQPPAKKRKRNYSTKSNNNSNKRQFEGQPAHYTQHWDDPGTSPQQVAYGECENEDYPEEGVELEGAESRELTHEEIWDDSALIGAWNAANEEYEAFHGPSKNWKSEPIHRSALWYNVPLSPSRLRQATPDENIPSTKPTLQSGVEVEQNSPPLDFDTFVPTHDASLNRVSPEMADTNPLLSDSAQTATQDEAFSKALNAMYWTGYWTAVYHCRKDPRNNEPNSQVESNGIDQEEEEEDTDLVPSQR